MKTIVITEPGAADALQWREVELPQPGPGELRIRTVAAAVNPVDVITRQGAFHQLGWIQGGVAGIGWDVAGYVEAVGPDVAGWKVGAAVAGIRAALDTPIGAYGDALVLPLDAVAAIPPGLGFAEASSVPLNALTADQALNLLDLPSGASLLITGAAGAVGGFAVALAARRGWQVTALARAGDEDFLRAAGASQVIATLPAQARYDGVLDAAVLGDAALQGTRDGGRYVGVIPSAVPEVTRGIHVQAVQVRPDGRRLAELLALAAEGVLAPRLAGLLPMASAAEAHRRLEQGGQRGRWVLVN